MALGRAGRRRSNPVRYVRHVCRPDEATGMPLDDQSEKVQEPHLFAVRRRIEPERQPIPVIAAQLSFLCVFDGYTAIEDQRLPIV